MTDQQPNDPVSWRTVRADTPLQTADGTTFGKVLETLGSDAEDIFHGLRVALDAGHREVAVPVDDITFLGEAWIETDLNAAGIAALPDFSAAPAYHVGEVGRFRPKLGWKEDAKSDEEPG